MTSKSSVSLSCVRMNEEGGGKICTCTYYWRTKGTLITEDLEERSLITEDLDEGSLITEDLAEISLLLGKCPVCYYSLLKPALAKKKDI